MKRYLETRTPNPTSSTAGADLARHLLSRQHLGKTVVVCEKPIIEISVVRKYWFKLSRQLQRQRASTLNAEKILQLTYDITRMQHMDFVAKSYQDSPNSDVFFAAPDELHQLPTHCFSVYLLAAPSDEVLKNALAQMPDRGLVIDYTHDPVINTAPLLPKFQLEQLLPEAWECVEQFLNQQHINIRELAKNPQRADRIDEAIDVILNTSSQFLRLADEFLELVRLSQPLHTTNSQQQLYDLLTLLDRRVYALTPGTLSQQFIRPRNDSNLEFHDVSSEYLDLALVVY